MSGQAFAQGPSPFQPLVMPKPASAPPFQAACPAASASLARAAPASQATGLAPAQASTAVAASTSAATSVEQSLADAIAAFQASSQTLYKPAALQILSTLQQLQLAQAPAQPSEPQVALPTDLLSDTEEELARVSSELDQITQDVTDLSVRLESAQTRAAELTAR
eukprot:15263302-Alexandrium_andersonii.AAC.1